MLTATVQVELSLSAFFVFIIMLMSVGGTRGTMLITVSSIQCYQRHTDHIDMRCSVSIVSSSHIPVYLPHSSSQGPELNITLSNVLSLFLHETFGKKSPIHIKLN